MVEMNATQIISFSYVVMSVLVLSNFYAAKKISEPRARKIALSLMSFAVFCTFPYAAVS